MALPLSCQRALVFLLAIISFIGSALAENAFVVAKIGEKKVRVEDNRRPALYTGAFGDCMGSSSINVSRFDAAYYKDNMTVSFHLEGDTALRNESIMMYIGVYAYGESRFELTFNPCDANIWSACPMQAGVHIQASGIIPINDTDAATIPPIALEIPDFEGQALLRIFSNSTQSEIGCFSAAITNGGTFSQPAFVGTVLGIFTVVAVIASFATAIYGNNIAEMRKHYAHSMSVFVVFAVWHHIFFSGALSMNWPSVLVAFWSNYAWAGGMIYTERMQNTINNFIGSNKGNTSAVGAAGTGVRDPDLAVYDIRKIYQREMSPKTSSVPSYSPGTRNIEQTMAKREIVGHKTGFSWYGSPVKPGLPLPGNYSGFAGTLAPLNIPASNAFMTGFLWFLILIAAVALAVVTCKAVLEGLNKMKLIKTNRLAFFRANFLGYTLLAVFRTGFIGSYMIIFLCMFQFTYLTSPGPVALACVTFLAILIGLGGLAAYACFYRIRFGNYVSETDRLNIEKTKVLQVFPMWRFSRASTTQPSEDRAYTGSLAWWRVRASTKEDKSIHNDGDYTKAFGWLASRFRRTRWWFFVVWLVYEFVRACLLAGASGHPKIQVFSLLAIEFFAFVGIIIIRPFEGQRLNLIVVYLLGFSKVATAGLSAAFDTSYNLPRIPATVIGIVIIVIQGFLTMAVLIAIMVGVISTYFSMMRNRDEIRPKKWNAARDKYFKQMDIKVHDMPPPPPKTPPPPEPPKGPYFNVNSIKRFPKIEDEDPEFIAEIRRNLAVSQTSLSSAQRGGDRTTRSGAPSLRSQMSYTSLPQGAKLHRASWSSLEFQQFRARGNSLTFTPGPESRPGSRGMSHLYPQPGPATPILSHPLSTFSSIPSPFRLKNDNLTAPRRPQLHTVKSETDLSPLPRSSH